MKTEVIYEMESLYREPFRIVAHHFGGEQKTLCVLGSMRGNEIQQLYIAGLLVKRLKALEEAGLILKNYGITVIPSANIYSANISKRFWAMDNSDINRMFPGYNLGETTQRIAAGLFEHLQGYRFGVQLASFYIPGKFVPHVRLMDTQFQDTGLAQLFGLPFVVLRKPVPFDTTTLNFNWQVWGTNAFSLYSGATDRIDQAGAELAVSSVLRFLARMHVIQYNVYGGFESTIFPEKELTTIRAQQPGIFLPSVDTFQTVTKGQELAQILDTLTGEVISRVTADEDGIVFFRKEEPLVMEHEELFMIIPKLHR
jgi:hypothetical protein